MTSVAESVVPAIVFSDGIELGRRREKKQEGGKESVRKTENNTIIPTYTTHITE